MTDDRIARFEERRAALAKLSDDELKERFWNLTNEVVAPILDLAKGHTSPSIERAVLLRMGIDSVTTQGVVQRISDAGLLGKTEEDKIEDFDDLYDFEEAFRAPFRPRSGRRPRKIPASKS